MAKESQMSAQEKEWQAESDLRTLIDAEKVKKDKSHLDAAMKKQKEMKADLEKIEVE